MLIHQKNLLHYYQLQPMLEKNVDLVRNNSDKEFFICASAQISEEGKMTFYLIRHINDRLFKDVIYGSVFFEHFDNNWKVNCFVDIDSKISKMVPQIIQGKLTSSVDVVTILKKMSMEEVIAINQKSYVAICRSIIFVLSCIYAQFCPKKKVFQEDLQEQCWKGFDFDQLDTSSQQTLTEARIKQILQHPKIIQLEDNLKEIAIQLDAKAKDTTGNCDQRCIKLIDQQLVFAKKFDAAPILDSFELTDIQRYFIKNSVVLQSRNNKDKISFHLHFPFLRFADVITQKHFFQVLQRWSLLFRFVDMAPYRKGCFRMCFNKKNNTNNILLHKFIKVCDQPSFNPDGYDCINDKNYYIWKKSLISKSFEDSSDVLFVSSINSEQTKAEPKLKRDDNRPLNLQEQIDEYNFDLYHFCELALEKLAQIKNNNGQRLYVDDYQYRLEIGMVLKNICQREKFFRQQQVFNDKDDDDIADHKVKQTDDEIENKYFNLWADFYSLRSQEFDPVKYASKWQSFRNDRPDKIGLRRLMKFLKDNKIDTADIMFRAQTICALDNMSQYQQEQNEQNGQIKHIEQSNINSQQQENNSESDLLIKDPVMENVVYRFGIPEYVINKRYVHLDDWDFIHSFSKNLKIYGIKSEKGTGKTTSLIGYLFGSDSDDSLNSFDSQNISFSSELSAITPGIQQQQSLEKSVLGSFEGINEALSRTRADKKGIKYEFNMMIITYRVTLALKLFSDLKKHGFTLYKSPTTDFKQFQPRFICQIDSLHKIPADYIKNYHYLAIDEFQGLSRYMITKHFNSQSNSLKSYLLFKQLLQSCSQTYLLDADLDYDTFLIMLSFAQCDKSNAILLNNEYKTFKEEGYEVIIMRPDNMVAEILEYIKVGKKVYLATLSINFGEFIVHCIKQKYPNKKILFISSKDSFLSKQRNTEDVNVIWADQDIVIFTPAITTGVSFDIEYFDACFSYACGRSSPSQELMQMLHRVRHTKEKLIYFALSEQFTLNNINDIVHPTKIIDNIQFYMMNTEQHTYIPNFSHAQGVDEKGILRFSQDDNYIFYKNEYAKIIKSNLNLGYMITSYMKSKEYKITLDTKERPNVKDTIALLRSSFREEKKKITEEQADLLINSNDLSEQEYESKNNDIANNKIELNDDERNKLKMEIDKFKFKRLYQLTNDHLTIPLVVDYEDEYTKDKYRNLQYILTDPLPVLDEDDLSLDDQLKRQDFASKTPTQRLVDQLQRIPKTQLFNIQLIQRQQRLHQLFFIVKVFETFSIEISSQDILKFDAIEFQNVTEQYKRNKEDLEMVYNYMYAMFICSKTKQPDLNGFIEFISQVSQNKFGLSLSIVNQTSLSLKGLEFWRSIVDTKQKKRKLQKDTLTE